MATFPADTAFDDSAVDFVDVLQDNLADLLLATRQLPGGRVPETVTISGGQITVSQAFVLVDTEGAASSDYLDNIVAPDLPDGSLVCCMAFSTARVPVIRARRGGTGQIDLAGDGNPETSLDAPNKGLLLRKNGDRWTEVLLRASETPLRQQGSIEFGSSGTWIVPAGVTKARLTQIAAGGGGGGGAGTNTDGSPGVAGGNGGNGGDTTVAGLPGGDLTATGGTGGGGGQSDGRGGAAAGNGRHGSDAFATSAGRATVGPVPVVGAFNSRGRGGNGGLGANANTGFTGGGGGATGAPGNLAYLDALVEVTPGSTLTITIGAGGSAGAAGTGTFANGFAGGAGQDGYVRIQY